MPSCVFRFCKNTSKNVGKSSGITFHRFLRPENINREEWIKTVQTNRSEYTWIPSDHSCICSMHFKADDFYRTKTGRRFLKESAIPYNSLKNSGGGQPMFPTSLDNVQMSNSESLLDTPMEIKYKKHLKISLASKKMLTAKIKKLQRQNRNLKLKTKTLTVIVKHLKDKCREIESELIKKDKMVDMYSNTLLKLRKSKKQSVHNDKNE